MKPIFLVIVGSAMLMPSMQQYIFSNESNMPEKKAVLRIPPVEIPQRRPDSDVLIHDISFWLERLP